MRRCCTFVTLTAAVSVACGSVHAEPVRVELDHTVSLPNITIEDQPAHIHTQGLYLDDEHIYVTGRLERAPKRPLFLRFHRDDTNKYDVLDLSIRDGNLAQQSLDHPGGFDFDGKDFWIPLARSHPAGPSAVVRVALQNDVPFEHWQPALAFQVEDHIGAIAYRRPSERLYGANWDTKRIHIWQRDGTPVASIPKHEWIVGDPRWALAVQDWKGAGQGHLAAPGTLMAGGIDNSPDRDPDQRAVVELYQPQTRTRLARMHVPAVGGYAGPATNEGMCLYGRWLVLLPADLGRNAKLYFFERP